MQGRVKDPHFGSLCPPRIYDVGPRLRGRHLERGPFVGV